MPGNDREVEFMALNVSEGTEAKPSSSVFHSVKLWGHQMPDSPQKRSNGASSTMFLGKIFPDPWLLRARGKDVSLEQGAGGASKVSRGGLVRAQDPKVKMGPAAQTARPLRTRPCDRKQKKKKEEK